jgi:hypothetical protein
MIAFCNRSFADFMRPGSPIDDTYWTPDSTIIVITTKPTAPLSKRKNIRKYTTIAPPFLGSFEIQFSPWLSTGNAIFTQLPVVSPEPLAHFVDALPSGLDCLKVSQSLSAFEAAQATGVRGLTAILTAAKRGVPSSPTRSNTKKNTRFIGRIVPSLSTKSQNAYVKSKPFFLSRICYMYLDFFDNNSYYQN